MTVERASFRSFVDVLQRRADERGDAEAVSFLEGDETTGAVLSYGALDRRARAIAARLGEGLSPGDRALLVAPTGPAYVTAFFGCLYAGVIAVTAYPPRRRAAGDGGRREDPRLAAIVGSAAPRAILGSGEVLGKLEDDPSLRSLERIDVAVIGDDAAAAWRAPSDPGRVALLQYTSGATATPRGVRVTHENLLHNTALIKRRCSASAQDRLVGWLPLFHDMGLVGLLLQSIYVGCPVTLMQPSDFLQKPLRWLAAMSRLRATSTGAPDWGYDRCVQQTTVEERASLDLGALRVCCCGAEPIRAQTLDAFARAFGPCGFRREAFLPCYGLAEATLFVSGGGPHRGRIHRMDAAALARNEVRPAEHEESARLLVGCGASEDEDGTHVAIVDPETGRRAPPDRIGEIWIAGPSVTDGYWNEPEETAALYGARLADTGERPFLRTGDLGFLADGELVVTGRRKEVIIVRGENHYPQDVEAAAEALHPAIATRGAAAFGVEIDGREQCVVVVELTRSGARKGAPELDEVVASVRGAVAEATGLTLAAVALIMPLSLPRTSSGKVRRRAAKEAWIEGRLDLVRGWTAGPREVEGAGAPAASEGHARALRFLLDVAAEVLHLPSAASVRPDMSLRRAGFDSLGLVDLKRRIEKALGVDVPLAVLDDDPSFTALAERLSGLGGASQVLPPWPRMDATSADVAEPPLDLEARHRIALLPVSDVFARARALPLYSQLRDADLMAFYKEFGERRGAFVKHRERDILQLGSLDYLGLSMDERVRSAAAAAAMQEGASRTGSRLHNGSTARQRHFEQRLAGFLGREDALVFATGYQAQVGLISGLMDPDSVLLLDELAHASSYDGARIAGCRVVRFSHSDPVALDRALGSLPRGAAAMVVSEGMYSNEGDIPPLSELVAICRRHGARLALDEAHSLGVLGAHGKGIEEELGLPGAADVLSGTLSKSLGSIGGWIAGPGDVIDWIRFNARSILFSAAIAPSSLAAAEAALGILVSEPERVGRLRGLAERWRAELRARSIAVSAAVGPIVPIHMNNDMICLKVARELLNRGIYVNAVVAPSAPRGRALLRTCVTALHEPKDLEWAASVIADTVAKEMPQA